jgi:hypothetical protein
MMNVYFTVDTESSMAGAWRIRDRRPLKAADHVFCRIDGQDYGIGLITKIIGSYGFRATHFVETLATLVNGSDDSRTIFDYLLASDQDVQLHAHPSYYFYAEALRVWGTGKEYRPPEPTDFIGGFDEPRQFEILQEAAGLFEQFAGYRPAAFRAGCFAGNRATLRCLQKLGIVLDSSFNPCFPECSFQDGGGDPNRVCVMEGVWEVPVTVARTPLPENRTGFKHADVSALSVTEIQTMLKSAAAQGQRHFVLLFHCFSAVKPKDETYSSIRPDRIVIRRLERLMHFLASNTADYRVSTFGELAREIATLREEQGPVGQLGLMAAGLRKSVQAVNRCYWI